MRYMLIWFGSYCVTLSCSFYVGYIDNAPVWFYYYMTGCVTIIFIAISGIIESIDSIGK